MKLPKPYRSRPFYPHIVHRGSDHDRRFDLQVSNRPLSETDRRAAYAVACEGAVATDGTVTQTGRAAVVRALQERIHPTSEVCVVWGPRSCTFVTRDGTIDGDDPPIGVPRDVAAMTGASAPIVNGAWLPLPSGCRASHLFLRRLCADRVEISTAAPMRLAIWDDPVRDDEIDPFADCYDENGDFRRPRVLMGVETTGVEGSEVLGPVQPDGEGRRVVSPWPSSVRKACLELAGRPLPADLVARAWRSVEKRHDERYLWSARRAD